MFKSVTELWTNSEGYQFFLESVYAFFNKYEQFKVPLW